MDRALDRRKLFLFRLVLAITWCRSILGKVVLAEFREQALAQHNYYRQLHCTEAMVINSSLNTIAQKYADYLAVNNLFNHSHAAAGLGENLWAMSSSVINFVNGSTPTADWYNEISSYSFSSPGFSSLTGHFTQVIWEQSRQLGIGIAFSSDKQIVKVVANYYPAGNVLGQFPSNVLPPCTSRSSVTLIGTKSKSRLLEAAFVVHVLFRALSRS